MRTITMALALGFFTTAVYAVDDDDSKVPAAELEKVRQLLLRSVARVMRRSKRRSRAFTKSMTPTPERHGRHQAR